MFQYRLGVPRGVINKWKLIAIANARHLDLDWIIWRCFKISFEGPVSLTLLLLVT